MLHQQRGLAAPEHIFARSPVFRRLRNWPSDRDHRPAELDVYVFEQFLTLPKMDKLRAYLAGQPPKHIAMAVLDLIRLAAGQRPAGTFDSFCLDLRGRLIEDWGISSDLLVGAMLSAGMVRHAGQGVCVFTAPEMVTFTPNTQALPSQVQLLVDQISRGPYMAPKAVRCGRTSPPRQMRLGEGGHTAKALHGL